MTASAEARPGFAAGFLPTFRRALSSAFRGRKTLVLVAVLSLPPLLVLAAADRSPERRGQILGAILLFLYLQFLAPVAGLLFGTGILLDELGSGNLPYLFTRPAPRSSILLGKYAAALVAATLGVGVSLAATLALSSGALLPDGFAGRAVLAVMLAIPAYLAAFAFLSSLTRWALVGGFLYAFGLEGVLGLIPGMIRKVTLLYYSRSILGEWAARRMTMEVVFGEDGPATTTMSVTVLLAVAAVGLALLLLVVRRKEFVPRNAGRG